MKTNSKKFSIKDWFEKNKLYILEEKKLKELAQAIEKGEHNYDSASKRVDSWGTKLNRTQTQVLKANRAVQQNEKYMHEAENATDAKVRYKGKVGHVNKKFIE